MTSTKKIIIKNVSKVTDFNNLKAIHIKNSSCNKIFFSNKNNVLSNHNNINYKHFKIPGHDAVSAYATIKFETVLDNSNGVILTKKDGYVTSTKTMKLKSKATFLELNNPISVSHKAIKSNSFKISTLHDDVFVINKEHYETTLDIKKELFTKTYKKNMSYVFEHKVTDRLETASFFGFREVPNGSHAIEVTFNYLLSLHATKKAIHINDNSVKKKQFKEGVLSKKAIENERVNKILPVSTNNKPNKIISFNDDFKNLNDNDVSSIDAGNIEAGRYSLHNVSSQEEETNTSQLSIHKDTETDVDVTSTKILID